MMDRTDGDNQAVADNGIEKLSPMTKIFYASGSITETLMGNIIGALAMPIYFVALGLDVRLVTMALMIPRLWDGIADPIVANMSDNLHTRFGRRKPFILVGVILTAVVCSFLWMPPANGSQMVLFAYFLGFSLLYYTVYTVFSIPFHALGPELTSDYNERINLMSYKSVLMGIGATLFLPWVYKLCLELGEGSTDVLPEVAGARIVGPIIGVLMIFFAIFPLVFTKEKFANANKEKISILKAMKFTFRNKPFVVVCVLIVATIFGAYLVAPLGFFINMGYVVQGEDLEEVKNKVATLAGVYSTIYGIVSIVSVFVINFISKRWGKKNTLIAGLFLTLLSYLFSWFLFTPEMPYLQLVHAVIAAPGMSALWLLTAVFIADVCDYDELKTGLRREGMYTAVFGWFMKVSVAGVTGLSGVVIAWTRFDREIVVQTAETIMKLRLSFVLVPVVFLLIAMYVTSLYSLNRKRMDEIQVQLKENRRLLDCQLD